MKKHTKQIVSGVILFILGGIVIPTLFSIFVIIYAVGISKPLVKFTIPGQVTVTIDKPGRYYLWNDYQTIFEGETFFSPEELPDGLTISLLEKEHGSSVIFTPEPSISSSGSNSAKNSLGYFEIIEPAMYTLSVLGETTPRVVSLGKTIFSLKNILIFLGCGTVFGTTAIIGFILFIIGIINLVKAKKPT